MDGILAVTATVRGRRGVIKVLLAPPWRTCQTRDCEHVYLSHSLVPVGVRLEVPT